VFARIVTMRLKPNSGAEFTQAMEKRVLPILRKQKGFKDELTFIAQSGTEAVGISLWDKKEDAKAYETASYAEVMKELSTSVDGSPRVQEYQISNSTAHNIGSKAA
jgi:heme-degrading monooxygenase HmoA